MEPNLDRVIAAIISEIERSGSYVTKTKLLKILYLFDIEYYRMHRRTFTGFSWKYFHLGPWTAEFEPLLESLLAQGFLTAAPSVSLEHDTKFLKSQEPVDFFKLFPEYKDERALRIVVNTWGSCTTAEILDYVYFRTEPMEYGTRNNPLDFSVIPEAEPARYARSSSGKTESEIRELRRRFRQELASDPLKRVVTTITAPKYDDEFAEALEKLETMD